MDRPADLYRMRQEARANFRGVYRSVLRSTFYVTSSPSNKSQVELLADYFKSRGLRWAFDHDWTAADRSQLMWPGAALLAHQDIQASVSADLFVALLTAPLDIRSHSDLAARLAHNREAHLVRQGVVDRTVLHSHPSVIEHESPESLLSYLFSRA